jgi:hypothetical protein
MTQRTVNLFFAPPLIPAAIWPWPAVDGHSVFLDAVRHPPQASRYLRCGHHPHVGDDNERFVHRFIDSNRCERLIHDRLIDTLTFNHQAQPNGHATMPGQIGCHVLLMGLTLRIPHVIEELLLRRRIQCRVDAGQLIADGVTLLD